MVDKPDACTNQCRRTSLRTLFARQLPASDRSQSSFIHRHDCAVSNGLAAGAQTEPARISPTYITPLTTLFPNPNAQPPNYTYRSHKPRFPSGPHITEKETKKYRKPTQKSPCDDDNRQPTFRHLLSLASRQFRDSTPTSPARKTAALSPSSFLRSSHLHYPARRIPQLVKSAR
jgi:hypothetical protein